MSCILSFCFGMMRLILSAPLLLVAHASVALGQYRTGETDWTVYSRVDSAVQMYKVDKVSGPVVYGQERMFINGKSVLGVTMLNFDCKGNIMHGQYATWSRGAICGLGSETAQTRLPIQLWKKHLIVFADTLL